MPPWKIWQRFHVGLVLHRVGFCLAPAPVGLGVGLFARVLDLIGLRCGLVVGLGVALSSLGGSPLGRRSPGRHGVCRLGGPLVRSSRPCLLLRVVVGAVVLGGVRSLLGRPAPHRALVPSGLLDLVVVVLVGGMIVRLSGPLGVVVGVVTGVDVGVGVTEGDVVPLGVGRRLAHARASGHLGCATAPRGGVCRLAP
jgi:hypothetical protein